MQAQKKFIPEPTKPNLKHDNMEYNASTDGEDILDKDKVSSHDDEEDEITAEELELLHKDDADNQAAALNSAESDSLSDADNFLNEKEEKEEFEDYSKGKVKQKRN